MVIHFIVVDVDGLLGLTVTREPLGINSQRQSHQKLVILVFLHLEYVVVRLYGAFDTLWDVCAGYKVIQVVWGDVVTVDCSRDVRVFDIEGKVAVWHDLAAVLNLLESLQFLRVLVTRTVTLRRCGTHDVILSKVVALEVVDHIAVASCSLIVKVVNQAD